MTLSLVLGACQFSGAIGDPQQAGAQPDSGVEVGVDVWIEDVRRIDDVDPLETTRPLSEGCAQALLSCPWPTTEALSCSVSGARAELAYEGEVAVQLLSNPSRTEFALYEHGALCVSGAYPVDNLVALPPEPGRGPVLDTWRFEDASGSLRLQVFDTWVLAECPDGTFDRYDLAEVAPLLPSLTVPEGDLCEETEALECTSDISCPGLDVCCPVVSQSRCLAEDLCPAIGTSGGLGPCLTPLFDCFGPVAAASSCVDRSDGVTAMSYPGERSAVVEVSDAGWTVSASAGAELCFVAELEGSLEEWTSMKVSSPADGAQEVVITREGDTARVVCDGDVRDVPVSALGRQVPPLMEAFGPSCVQGCASNSECGSGSCCPGPDGAADRCVPLARCYDPADPLLSSCLAGPLWCYGREHVLSDCRHAAWEHLDFTEATYADGAEALFFESMARPSVEVSAAAGVPCFRFSRPAADTIALTDAFERQYRILLDGDSASVVCPDDSEESFAAASVLAYLPEEPDPAGCADATRLEICQGDADCGAEMICCDQGAFTDCLPSYGVCAELSETCTDDGDCPDGQACCPVESARVCDLGLCGDALCCDIAAADVCQPSGACQ